MKFSATFVIVLAVIVLPATTRAQEPKRSEAEFVTDHPAVGDSLPDLVVYDPNGQEVKTSSLRGHHTVLTFGCLT